MYAACTDSTPSPCLRKMDKGAVLHQCCLASIYKTHTHTHTHRPP
uniref:Uncharacterized protein n=1 Tax=Anguilla anguilla TaxID=7936 RepID=A0A0E9VP37_ANGAN